MIMSNDEAQKEVNKLKQQTKQKRKTRFHKSRLDQYHDSLISMFNARASKAELQRWLETKGIKVVWTTVHRWLLKHG